LYLNFKKNKNMAPVLINDIEHFAHDVDELDDSPFPFSEEEYVSLEEFKAYMEKLAFDRLGLELTL